LVVPPPAIDPFIDDDELFMFGGGDRLGVVFIAVCEIPVWTRSGEPRNTDGDGIVIVSIQRQKHEGVKDDFGTCQTFLIDKATTQWKTEDEEQTPAGGGVGPGSVGRE
jgi:hypothetical protein